MRVPTKTNVQNKPVYSRDQQMAGCNNGHPLQCTERKKHPTTSRLKLLNQFKICTTNHSAKECQVKLCHSHCDSTRHCSILLGASCASINGPAGRQFIRDIWNPERVLDGLRTRSEERPSVFNRCTDICGSSGSRGRFCSKILSCESIHHW